MILFAGLSIACIILALGWMFYSVLGGLPLFILKYDEPNDWRLVRGFFDVHYKVLVIIAGLGTICCCITGRYFLGASFAAVTTIGVAALIMIVKPMTHLRAEILARNSAAIGKFRWLHAACLALSVTQIGGMVWVVSRSTLETCIKLPPACADTAYAETHQIECRRQCSLLATE